MGSVWRATHLTLGSPVAIKFVAGPCQGEQIGARFLREARMCAAVRHRNVVQINDFGTTDDGPYMVMELLEGRPFGDEVRGGKIDIPRVVDIIGQTLRGLAAVHHVGVVHRDLKPDNIFLVEDADSCYPKLIDFGVGLGVEATAPESALTTSEGLIAGTPAFMAPEQARGLPDLDARADVYAVGCIMYRALTGQNAFAAKHVGDLIVKKLTQEPPQLVELMPEQKDLSAFLGRAMARQREARFQSASEMLAALRALASRAPTLQQISVARMPRRPANSGSPSSSAGNGSDGPAPGDASHATADRSDSAPSTPLVWDDPVIQPSTKLRAPRWAVGLILAIALCAGALLALSSGGSSNTVAAAAQAPAEPAPGAKPKSVPEKHVAEPEVTDTPPEADAGPPPPVTVTLVDLPQDATVYLDGEQVDGRRLRVPRDGEPHTIRIEKRGYRPLSIEHIGDAHGRYQATMKRLPKPSRKKRVRRAPAAEIAEELDF